MSIDGMAILLISFWQVGIGVQQAREAYFRSAESKKQALYFEQMLDSISEDASPVLVCYKGAAEMLKAKNTVNPFNKLFFFKRGKNLIDRSIARDTSNLECHFIRFTIQRNLPGFLDYNTNVRKDSIMIVSELDNMTDLNLKNKIMAYFNHQKATVKNKQ